MKEIQLGAVNDPTNWNVDPAVKVIEGVDPALAKEMERRWNAHEGLMRALQEIAILAEYGTTGPSTEPPCKSPALNAAKATGLRGAISGIARKALGTPIDKTPIRRS
jgi:hypothetical protein